MSTERENELQRITDLSNNIWPDWCYETRTKEPYQLLCAVLHNLTTEYFRRSINDRKSTAQLLDQTDSNLKERIKTLYAFVSRSNMSDFLKCHLLEGAYGFIKECGASSAELAALDAVYNTREQDLWGV
jgi:hypothetical protein